MATITLSGSNASICRTLAYENNSYLGDASFSSYLKSSEEMCALKRTESAVKPSVTITSPQDPKHKLGLVRNKDGHGEISVFGAEKYFNGVMDDGEKTITANKGVKKHKPKKDDRVDIQAVKANGKSTTPSTCSEASWNSRSVLLPVRQSRQEKASNGKNFFATLGCNCYRSDSKSVDVDKSNLANKSSKKNGNCGEIHGGKVAATLPIEFTHDPVGLVQIKKTLHPSWLKQELTCNKSNNGDNVMSHEDCFTFPISKSGVGNLSLETMLETVEEETVRMSLEVFGSPVMAKDEIASSLEKRLAMLTWDANPKVENSPIVPANSNGSNGADDTDSDSSSDLFEIKSLSTNVDPFFKRQSSDSTSGCMSPSTCYEPSEASIDWSVVTASAANFSAASGCDEPKSNTKDREILKTAEKTRAMSEKTKMSKGVTKRNHPGMLLGCRSHKAVNVVGGAHMVPEKKSELNGHSIPNSFTPRSRFQAESKVTDLKAAHAFAKGPLSRLHSIQATDSIYIH